MPWVVGITTPLTLSSPRRPQLSGSVTFSKRYPGTSVILTLSDIFCFCYSFFLFVSWFQLFRHLSFLFSGNSTNFSSLDAFAQRLFHLAFAASTHKNIKSHVNVYTRFCHSVRASPFPVQIDLLIRYVAYLTLSGRTYATIINHIGSLKHVNQLLGFGKVWDTHYRCQLVLRGVKRYLGVSPNRKHPITPELVLQVYYLYMQPCGLCFSSPFLPCYGNLI